MTTPPTQPSLKIEKTFTYRGVPRIFSNRYFLDGGTPSDSTHWTTLADAVTTAEKAVYPSTGFTGSITAAYGYAAGSDVPVFSKTYALNWTMGIGAGCACPGDCAVLVRYSTSARTSKNHPIYLYNYYHGAVSTSTTSGDTVLAAQVTAMGTYAAAWIAGFSDGTLTLKRTGPYGHLGTGYVVNTKVHHRDFPGG
jgi:hypothetical protein